MHGEPFGAGYCYRHAAIEEQHGALGLMDQEIQMSKRLRAGASERLHLGRPTLMAVRAAVGRKKIDTVSYPVAALGRDERIGQVGHFRKRVIHSPSQHGRW